MGTAIIDASALLPVFVNADTSAAARDFYAAHDLIAPALIVSECANALWKYVRSNEMDLELARTAYSAMFNQIELVPDESLEMAPLELAAEYDHPAYDCFYLALSEQKSLPLITGDKRLVRKFDAASPFDIINIHNPQ